MKVLELKTLCRERGLPVSGTKKEVIIRLMEHDEAMAPAPTQVHSGQPPLASQGQVVQPMTIPTQESTAVPVTFGIFIMLYGFFRIGVNFLYAMADPSLEVVIAMCISFAYVTGGILTMMTYRNGLYLTLVTLVFSGLLSMLFSGEASPLSATFGELSVVFTLSCSMACIGITTLPLLIASNQLNPGWPEPLENLFEGLALQDLAGGVEKVETSCPECDQSLRHPEDYSGNIRCPECDHRFSV